MTHQAVHAQAAAQEPNITVEGHTITAGSTATLHGWVASAGSQFTEEERKRAERSLRFLRARLRHPYPRRALVAVRSVVLAILAVALSVYLVVFLALVIRDTPAAVPEGESLEGALGAASGAFILPMMLLLAVCLVLTLAIPTALRVIAGLVGVGCALYLLVMQLVGFSSLGVDAGPPALATLLLGVVLVVSWAIGGRR